MRIVTGLAVTVVLLSACSSNTDSAEPDISATTVVQQDVNSFCQDVKDAIENRDSADPEDQAERLADLQEAAQQLGIGTRDDIYAADALTKCADELQDAINGQ